MIDALGKSNRMWQRLGKLLEDTGHDIIAGGTTNLWDAEKAVEFTKLAEGCYWQATGDNDAFDLPRKKENPNDNQD
jgi:hypothetical protein